MQVLILLTAALVPLIMSPGLQFHFDITPKVALLLTAVSIMLFHFHAVRHHIAALLSTTSGRWFASILVLQVISFAVSAFFSVDLWLSVDGSEWRRLGLYTFASIVVFTVITAGWLRSEANAVLLLRWCALGAIPIGGYAIAQYFGLDPFLPSGAYHAGEGPFTIVRPPGTLGHADYLACYLVFAFFVALTLLRVSQSRSARLIALTAATLSGAALLLAGTRAGLAGIVAGVVTLLVSQRGRVRRSQFVTGILVLLAAAAFVISPSGAKLRARIHWSREDRVGGARLLLWRDSIRMIAARPLVGYGPETFIREFPLFQSADLSRAYPDFFHESPHNIVLDAAASQGLPGALLLAAGWVVAAIAGIRAIRQGHQFAAPVLAGSVGLLVSHQFIVFVPATALVFLLSEALLISCFPAASSASQPQMQGWWRSAGWVTSSLVAVALCVYAVRLTAGDHYLELVRNRISAGKTDEAIRAHESVRSIEPRGGTAELYYSRELAAAASAAHGEQQTTLWKQALEAGVRCVSTCEQRANAWYSLATLLAAQNDSEGVERALRNAAAWAPNWFKPHWTLALLLQMKGRQQEAMSEAITAVDRNGGKNPEVLATWLTLANAARRP